ncbi:MAG TPA: DUF2993 domain-containing protein [Actinomycetota bacterium]|nr:DUF2993 domain-containing protein [Actinomycetota bacterium]
MKRLWVALAILVVVLVIADLAARSIAQREASAELRRRFDLTEAPAVEIGGFPFLLGVVKGELPSVSLKAEAIEGGDSVVLSDLDVELRRVTFSLSKLLDGEMRSLRAASGDGTAALTSDSLNNALKAAGAGVEVTIKGGEATVRARAIQGSARGTVKVSEQTLSVATADGFFSFDLHLPNFASGLTYESVELVGDRAVFSVSLSDASFAK